ncbi:hypothetical protein [Yersinia enterocolitica]|uniref:hypothetical protein n=1 Tax=Yersinia enterocolitica TaxID=630 RepID=UPI003063922B
MTIYTSDVGRGVNQPISNVKSKLSDVLKAEFVEGFNNSGIVSYYRASDWDKLNSENNHQVYGKKEAENVLNKYGISYISVPDYGLSKDALDSIVNFQIEHLTRTQILSSSPSSWVVDAARFSSNIIGNPSTWIVITLIISVIIFRRKRLNIK